MKSRKSILLVMLVSLVLIWICPALAEDRLAVPHISQLEYRPDGAYTGRNNCGPATLAMGIDAYGLRPAGDEDDHAFVHLLRYQMTGVADDPFNNGYTNFAQMRTVLDGYYAGLGWSNVGDMQDLEYTVVVERTPVIAFVDATHFLPRQYPLSWATNHFVVVTGFSDDGLWVYVNDPLDYYDGQIPTNGAPNQYTYASFQAAYYNSGLAVGGGLEDLPPGDNVALTAVSWSASSVFSGEYGGDQAYDGILAADSKWTSNGSGAESWLALDLGQAWNITGFVLRHAGAAGERSYHNIRSYRIEYGPSLSGPWASLATVTNTAQANHTSSILDYSVRARYVRLTILDAGIDDFARVPEFEVYAAEPENIALTALSWAASSSFNANYAGDKAFDGDISAESKWTSNGTQAESWLALDLGAVHRLSEFVVYHAGAAGERTYYNILAYRLEYGDTLNGPWQTIDQVDNEARDNSTATALAAPLATRYVRLYITDAGIDNYARIPEFEVWGIPLR
jgi:hypothetical protein